MIINNLDFQNSIIDSLDYFFKFEDVGNLTLRNITISESMISTSLFKMKNVTNIVFENTKIIKCSFLKGLADVSSSQNINIDIVDVS